MVGKKVRNPEFGVKCPDFYLVAMNSNFYNTLWGPKKHAGEPGWAHGRLPASFGLEIL